jgi:hypothetical protein
MRYLFGLLCVCALVALPLSASAQAGEAATASEENLQEPAPPSEPAPEEPALQLKLDDAGVDVVPSPPRTVDGYTLEEMELRVKRAKMGLLAPAALIVAGVPLWVRGKTSDCASFDPFVQVSQERCTRLRTSGAALTVSGAVGMIVGSILVGVRKGDLRWTVNEYTLEEMDVPVKRAKIGLGSSAAALFAGGMFMGFGIAESLSDWCFFEECAPVRKRYMAYVWTGTALLVGGFAGMVASGILLRRRKRDRDWLRQAHYATPRRAQWDLARSRLVF